ncbi:MAG: hypothetical protein U1C33_05990, partial [Candidatus Cloacimonadaceae bacterium]|nr:hypothetical protein [Candidatus Cloacimonadaceae bacterium]
DQLDEFIRREIFPHSEGWKIFFSFILSYLLEEHPDDAIPYIKMGMMQYPDNFYFAEFAVRYAVEFDKRPEIRVLLDEMKSVVLFNINEFYQRLNTMKK